MVNSGSIFKCALVAIVLVALARSGSAAEKLASCCKMVTKQEITEPILGYLVQKPNPPCVKAVIFQTKSGLFCSQLTAPWVRRKIFAFEAAKAEANVMATTSQPPVSLLSIITSTASSVSSSAPLSSFSSSTSDSPTDETFSGEDNE
ncbi:zinc finger CCHC domain-containing protein 10-like isoform X1 [Lates japonicus]|uniref:Zinc finger CCHC domain-containing protein 10-like isoform X1 n=1 Tax=Lates japonicus TaxID=270547 RepID=A0AAD3R464_LATJO|nr:zinc finger CCHC domain-containing protein 10-like isoform X1 [Lates japonicus]